MKDLNEKQMDAIIARMDDNRGKKMVFNLYRDSYNDMIMFCTFIKSMMKSYYRYDIHENAARNINKICDESILKAEKSDKYRYNMKCVLFIKQSIISEIEQAMF